MGSRFENSYSNSTLGMATTQTTVSTTHAATIVRENGNRVSGSYAEASPRVRRSSAPVRSAMLKSAGRTVSMDSKANRMPIPPISPNSLNPRKSASCRTNRAEAVVSAETAIPWPVLTNVSSTASATPRPEPRSSA